MRVQPAEVTGDVRPAWSLPAEGLGRRFHLRLIERRLLVLVGDAVMLLLALAVGVDAMNPSGFPLGFGAVQPIWLATLLAIWFVVAPAFDAYTASRLAYPLGSAVAASRAALVTIGGYFLTPYITPPLLNSRAVMLVFAASLLAFVLAWRVAAAWTIGQLVAPRQVLVVGAGWAGQTIAQAIAQSGDGYRLVGFVDDSRTARDADADPAVLGGRGDLERVIDARGVTDVVVTESTRMPGDLVKAVVRTYESGVNVVPMANLYETLTGRIPVEHVGDAWVGAMPQIERLGGLGAIVKRLVDLVLGTVGLLLLALLLPFIALAIRLDSPGPVVYSQERVGYRGRPFRMWKFRSMVERAEGDGRARWSRPGDPRVTRVGRFLRRTGLDELTQMINIVRGEMSLVGPRPERPEFVHTLEQRIPFYRARLLVKPGLTGWAQIKFRYGSSADDALVKLQYDLYYVKHRSLLLDALISVKTIGVVLRGRP